jgi:hypothetical protein
MKYVTKFHMRLQVGDSKSYYCRPESSQLRRTSRVWNRVNCLDCLKKRWDETGEGSHRYIKLRRNKKPSKDLILRGQS